MKISLADKIRQKENEESLIRKERIPAVRNIAINDGKKDKQISAKVNERVYALFSAINGAQGLSNNSALNLLITRYVRENQSIIDNKK